MSFWKLSPKSPIQKSCDTSQNFCMGFLETPALADCLNNFIFLNVASREVWTDKCPLVDGSMPVAA